MKIVLTSIGGYEWEVLTVGKEYEVLEKTKEGVVIRNIFGGKYHAPFGSYRVTKEA